MMKFVTALIALAAPFCLSAEVWEARYATAETFNFKLYNADGTLDVDEVDSGTEVSVSCNEGAETTATNDFADEGNFYSIALTSGEMTCERIAVVVAATTTEVFFIQTVGHASAMTPTTGWETGDAFARLGAPAGASVSADIAAIEDQTDEIGAAGAGLTAADDSVMTRLGAPAGASVSADIAAIEGQTDDIGVAGAGLTAIDLPNQTMDITGTLSTVTTATAVTTVNGLAANSITAAATAADFTTEVSASSLTLLEALVGLGAEQTADSGTTTTAVDAALTQATTDWFKGMGIHFTSGTLLGQDACVTGFTPASDTLTFAPAVTTAVTTHTYYLLPNSECFSGTSGSGATAQEVWEYATRSITVLDEDSTTLDLNATGTGAAASVTGSVGSIATGGITEASFATTAGSFEALGIVDQGTAAAVDATSLTLRAAADIGDAACNTLLITGGSDGVGQSVIVESSAGDVLTFTAWPDTTPTGTVTYELFGTACGAAGSGATAAEVWGYATRSITVLDEDTTTLDLNATTVGTVATLDEDATTIDLNATTLGTVTTATNVTTVNGLAADAITAAATAADFGTEIGTAAWATATRTLSALDEDSTTIDLDASTVGTVTTATNVTTVNGIGPNVLTAASAAADLTTELQNGLATAASLTTVDDFLDTEITALMNARTQIFPGNTDADSVLTADSGDTNTLVDAELTFSADQDIDGAYVVRSDGQRCTVDSFTAASDTIEFGVCTFTGAWSTQTYKLYPAGEQP
jgi:hypothetical protein